MRAPGATFTRSLSSSRRSRTLPCHFAPMMQSAHRHRMNSHSCSGSLMITHHERSWMYSGLLRISRACVSSTTRARGRTTSVQGTCMIRNASTSVVAWKTKSFE